MKLKQLREAYKLILENLVDRIFFLNSVQTRLQFNEVGYRTWLDRKITHNLQMCRVLVDWVHYHAELIGFVSWAPAHHKP